MTTATELCSSNGDPTAGSMDSLRSAAEPVSADTTTVMTVDQKGPVVITQIVSDTLGVMDGGITAESSEVEPEVGAEVELEADAESLTSSSDSEDGSEENVPELTYFRFTRLGLSITLNLNRPPPPSAPAAQPPKPSSVDTRGQQVIAPASIKMESPAEVQLQEPEAPPAISWSPLSACVIVDFEKACLEKYPSFYCIGQQVGRFSKLKAAELFSPSALASSVTTTAPTSSIVQGNSGPAGSSASSGSEIRSGAGHGDTTTGNRAPGGISAPSDTFFGSVRLSATTSRTEDRLSTVIQDILHRLNRQGTLADPRDVCRKGGGRSGNYYDKDDEFFDDSLTFEHLGLSSSSLYSPRGGRPQSRKFVDPRGVGNSFDDIIDDSFDELDEGDTGEDDDERAVYDYVDAAGFTCDNIPENDQLVLLYDAAATTSDDEDSDSSTSSRSDSGSLSDEEEETDAGGELVVGSSVISDTAATAISSEISRKKRRVLVTTKHWIRRKAWREIEPKLSADLVAALTKLEISLQGKGTRKGLFVSPIEVACMCRETVREVFVKEYPKVAWNASSFLASAYPDPSSSVVAQPGEDKPKVSLTTKPEVKGAAPDSEKLIATVTPSRSMCLADAQPAHVKCQSGVCSSAIEKGQTSSPSLSVEPAVACEKPRTTTDVQSVESANTEHHSSLAATAVTEQLILHGEGQESGPAAFSAASPASSPLCLEPVLEIDVADECSTATPTLVSGATPAEATTAVSREEPLRTSTLHLEDVATTPTKLCGTSYPNNEQRSGPLTPHEAPSGMTAGSVAPVKVAKPGASQAAPTTEKKIRKQPPSVPPSFRNTVTIDDIVALTTCPALRQLGVCLMKITNAVTPELLKRWLMMRLVLHNQVVYSALEERLYSFITKKSSLFRTRGSFFFRSLKKAVNQYLKSLASSTSTGSKANSGTPQPRTATSTVTGSPIGSGRTPPAAAPTVPATASPMPSTCKPGASAETDGKSTAMGHPGAEGVAPVGSSSVAAPGSSLAGPPPDSPFSPVAKELLNWAVVYNCRRHELKGFGETLDEWSAGFPAYAVEILNQSIQKRRQSGPSSTAAGTQSTSTAAQKKNRVWVPTKFLEETLTRFKEHYGVATLYERRSRKPVVPQFITPCKGLHPPALRPPRQHSSHPRGHSKQQQQPAQKPTPACEGSKGPCVDAPSSCSGLGSGSGSAGQSTVPTNTLCAEKKVASDTILNLLGGKRGSAEPAPTLLDKSSSLSSLIQPVAKKRKRKDAGTTSLAAENHTGIPDQPLQSGEMPPGGTTSTQRKRKKQQQLRITSVTVDTQQDEHCVEPASSHSSLTSALAVSEGHEGPLRTTINDYFGIPPRSGHASNQQHTGTGTESMLANSEVILAAAETREMPPPSIQQEVAKYPAAITIGVDVGECEKNLSDVVSAATGSLSNGIHPSQHMQDDVGHRISAELVDPVLTTEMLTVSNAPRSFAVAHSTPVTTYSATPSASSEERSAVPVSLVRQAVVSSTGVGDCSITNTANSAPVSIRTAAANCEMRSAPVPNVQSGNGKLHFPTSTTPSGEGFLRQAESSKQHSAPTHRVVKESHLASGSVVPQQSTEFSQNGLVSSLSSTSRNFPRPHPSFFCHNVASGMSSLTDTTSSPMALYMPPSNNASTNSNLASALRPQLSYLSEQQLRFHQMAAFSWPSSSHPSLSTSTLLTSQPLCGPLQPDMLYMPGPMKDIFYSTPMPTSDGSGATGGRPSRWDPHNIAARLRPPTATVIMPQGETAPRSQLPHNGTGPRP